jgi:Ca2+-binding RTX toxin-like protein
MTSLTVDPALTDPLSTLSVDFGFLEEQGSVISHTSKKIVIGLQSGGGTTLNGEGFGGFDGLGWPTTGVLQKLTSTQSGETVFTIAGMSIDVPLFRHLMESRDAEGSAQAIWGGDDQITTALGNDIVFGFTGDDLINGADGDDYLNGGAGQDTMLGGKGKDRFAFSNAADSTPLAPDSIAHLRNNDKIDLKGIDADRTVFGDQAFLIVGALSGEAGELAVAYDSGRDVTVVSGDTDGDGVANLVFEIAGDYDSFFRWIL